MTPEQRLANQKRVGTGGIGKAVCKTCGAEGPPWHHVPSTLDPQGIADPGHKMPTTANNGQTQRPDRFAYTNTIKANLAIWLIKSGAKLVEAETPRWGNADIVALTSDNLIAEYEIKTVESDMLEEIQAVKSAQRCVAMPERYYSSSPKFPKHRYYLGSSADILAQLFNKPNYFYFCVPGPLVELCRQKLGETPYGVINASMVAPNPSVRRSKAIIVEAKPLHLVPAMDEDVLYLTEKILWNYWKLKRQPKQ